MSTTVCPERTRATRPSGPRPTARTCGSPGRHMKTISARAATSAAEPAPATPSRASAASGSARWSNATTAAPDFLARLRHMASPITPSPMNPSVVAIVVLLALHVQRRPRACQARRGVTRLHYAAHEHPGRSEEHTSELQSLRHLVCRLLLEKKKNPTQPQQCTPLKNFR